MAKKKKSRQGEGGGPKFTRTDRTRLWMEAARLDRLGYNQFQIGDKLGVSQPMACEYLKKARRMWMEQATQERAQAVADKIELLRETRREAWEEWQRSKQDAEASTVEEWEGSKGGTSTKRILTKEGRLAGAEYMRIILDTIKQERELLGLDAPTKIMELQAQVTQVDWAAMMAPYSAPDEVEMKLQAIIDGPKANGKPSTNGNGKHE